MVGNQVLNTYLASQVPEITTIVAGADTAGSTAGQTIIATNALNNRVIYYNVVSGNSGVNPQLGVLNKATVLAVADSGGNQAGTYFVAGSPSPALNTYFYNSVTDQSYDAYLANHLPANKKYYNITFPADTGGNYDGGYFLFYDGAGTKYYVWFYESTGTDPAPGGATSLGKITIASNATAASIATAVANQINSNTKLLYATANIAASGKVSLINVADGTATIPTIGTIPSGWSVAQYTPVMLNASYDPQFGRQASYNILTVADVGGNLDGTYWTLYNGATEYYVWYSKNSSTTDPAPGGTGIKVSYTTGDSAATIRTKTLAALSPYDATLVDIFALSYNTNEFYMEMVPYGTTTSWSAGTSGFTVTQNFAGVAVVSALAGYVGIPISCVVNATAITIAAAITAAGNAYIDSKTGKTLWTITNGGTATATFVSVTQGTLQTAFSAGTSGFTPTNTVTGAFPTAGDVYVPVYYASGATANQVQAAYLIANIAPLMLNQQQDTRVLTDIIISGAAPNIVLTNRRGGFTGVATTTNTGWSNTRTQTGTNVLTTNGGANANGSTGAPVRYQYFPQPNETDEITQLELLIGTATTTTIDATKFGTISALTNGAIVSVRAIDGTVKKQMSLLKSNIDLAILSTDGFQNFTNSNATNSMWEATCFMRNLFGGVISINGQLGEYFEISFQDATTGSGPLYFAITGASLVGTNNIYGGNTAFQIMP